MLIWNRKHEKTHTRPYKCTYESCKYHVKGWPTEKERDRHINDKHSNTPKLYRCEYADCGYQSKRESNCKQHMEKTHGWVYVRSRNNGKQPQDRASAQPTVPTPPTPVLSTPPSVMGDFSTPTTGPSPTTALSVSPYALQTGFDTCQGFSFGDTPFPATTEEVMTDNSLRASPFMPTGGGDFLLYSDNQQSQPSQTMYPGSTPQGLTETQNAMFPTGMNNLMDNGVTTGMESGMNLSAPVGVGNLMLPTAMDNFAQTGGDNLFDGMQPPAPPGEVDEFQVFSEQFWSQMADAAALDGMNYGNVPC